MWSVYNTEYNTDHPSELIQINTEPKWNERLSTELCIQKGAAFVIISSLLDINPPFNSKYFDWLQLVFLQTVEFNTWANSSVTVKQPKRLQDWIFVPQVFCRYYSGDVTTTPTIQMCCITLLNTKWICIHS